MKINYKAINIYLITFVILTFITIITYKIGREDYTRSTPYISGAFHPKPWHEVWQYTNEILFSSFFMTLFIGSAFYYVNRNK